MGDSRFPIIGQEAVPVIAADYLRDFRCIGPECEDSCCIGWTNVSIDRETFKLYQEVRDPQLRPMFDELLVPNEGAAEHEAPMQIKMDQRSCCPFLGSDKLCGIQSKLGEPYLSTTCSMYPRISNVVRGVVERSANLSCPEVARLALSNPRGISFEMMEVEPHRAHQITAVVPDLTLPLEESPAGYFWEIRRTVLLVLQDRSLPLGTRLRHIGRFCISLQAAFDAEDFSKIRELVERYQGAARLRSHHYEELELENDLKLQALFQISVLQALFSLARQRGTASKRFAETLNECLMAFDFYRSPKAEKLLQQSRQSIQQFFNPFLSTHGFMLENYLVNQAFKNLFPSGSATSLWEEWVHFLAPFFAIRGVLIGLALRNHGIEPAQVVKLVQSFTKTFEHNPAMLQGFKKELFGERIPPYEELSRVFGAA